MTFNEWEGNNNDSDKNNIIHIGAEINISESVENVENNTNVDIQCCCIKVGISKKTRNKQ